MNNKEQQPVSLKAVTFPGLYPILYLGKHNEPLCNVCASAAFTDGENIQSGIYWEGPILECEECGCHIESAYGELDEEIEEENGCLEN